MIIVFLGPSLPRAEACRLLTADYRPPARQGDVFKAIEAAPEAIVLIDGVFEAAPSVWHHELIAAQTAGIPVYGACSMGALRAAELPGVVTPLGEIAGRFVRGTWNDDAAVALLHADEANGFRALSVPWVNVWATARAAQQAGVLSARRAQRLCDVAESLFYQSRTWRRLLDALAWPAGDRARLELFLRDGTVDLKAADARLCLAAVARAKPARRAPRASRLSSFVRRTRMPSGDDVGADPGVRTLLFAEFARHAGLTPDPERVAAWRDQLTVAAADVREGWAEALALEELVLSAPERFVPDGPSRREGAALSRALAPRRR